MYLNFFGLRSDPFRLDPNLNFVYISKSHEETIAHLIYGIEQGEDFVLITGRIGTGKTLALHFLLDQIVSSFKTAFINVTKVDFLELLKLILDDLDIEFEKDWDRADLLAALKKYLQDVRKRREKVLVVVDEAQNLDVDTLEGLRLLSNLSQPGDQVLQIILVGQPGLQQMIASEELEQLQQRIRVHYQLEELSRREVEEYIDHRMKVSGAQEQAFSRGALDKIFQFSHGVPRLVNQFAGKALLSAFVEETKVVKAGHVEEEEILTSEEETEPQVEEAPEPKSILRNPPPKKKHYSKKQGHLAHQAMDSIRDVALDEIRDTRETTRASHFDRPEKGEGSGHRKVLVWAACAVLVLASGFMLGGGWDWITGNSSSSAQPQEMSQPVAQDTAHESEQNLQAQNEAIQKLEDLENQAAGTVEDEPTADPVVEVVEEQIPPTQVAVAAPRPEPKPEPVQTPKALHVASFRNPEQANTLLNRLKDQGVQGYIKNQAVNGSSWYRVYLGPFADEDTANRVGQDLKNQKAVMYFRLMEMDNNGS